MTTKAENRKRKTVISGPGRRASDFITFGPGTKVSTPIPGVALCCMAPEYRDCLDLAMSEWKKHKQQLPKKIGGKKYVPGIYSFAYWLIRWSGIVQPAKIKLLAFGIWSLGFIWSL